MEQRLVEFVEVLRHNGLKVSVSETQDAARAVAELGLHDRAEFRATLKASLCKRGSEGVVFDRAFELYFSGAAATLAGLDASLADQLRRQGLLQGDELTMVIATLKDLGGQLAPLTDALMQGERGRLASLLRQATLQLDYSRVQNALQTGFYGRRLLQAMGAERVRSDLETIGRELEARGLSPSGVEVVSRELGALLRTLEESARREVQREVGARIPPPSPGLSDRPLNTLTRQEIEQAQRAVRALAQKLKSRLTRRRRHHRKGQLNPRLTLRKNLSTGGIPMVPVFRSRRPHRPDVMVLCDVSDSVRTTSRMMLLLTHALQSLFSRVRSFIFVSEIGEVTRHFRDVPPERAVEVATSSGVISFAANSNYGRALGDFARHSLGAVTRRTTVLIIGDGRNNFAAPNVWALAELKRKARRVLWICTEPKTNWGYGDSEMLRYAAAVSQVVVVRTLADLERVALDLVPT